MRLTDEKIEIFIHDQIQGFELGKHESIRKKIKLALEYARDFYENQKCVTCINKNESDWCNIIENLVEPHDDDFGCNQWEPRK